MRLQYTRIQQNPLETLQLSGTPGTKCFRHKDRFTGAKAQGDVSFSLGTASPRKPQELLRLVAIHYGICKRADPLHGHAHLVAGNHRSHASGRASKNQVAGKQRHNLGNEAD